jgi:DNA-directed RNA polymerase subunit RPC12/RpoP
MAWHKCNNCGKILSVNYINMVKDSFRCPNCMNRVIIDNFLSIQRKNKLDKIIKRIK